jgi:hypothetical protein
MLNVDGCNSYGHGYSCSYSYIYSKSLLQFDVDLQSIVIAVITITANYCQLLPLSYYPTRHTSFFLFTIDLLQSQENPNKFVFYEVYENLDAVAFHKEQPHFALWTKFKESGGVVNSVSHKTDGLFMSD